VTSQFAGRIAARSDSHLSDGAWIANCALG
jgi:hypothetical protein